MTLVNDRAKRWTQDFSTPNPKFSNICPRWPRETPLASEPKILPHTRCCRGARHSGCKVEGWHPSLRDSATRKSAYIQCLCVIKFQVRFHFVYFHYSKSALKSFHPIWHLIFFRYKWIFFNPHSCRWTFQSLLRGTITRSFSGQVHLCLEPALQSLPGDTEPGISLHLSVTESPVHKMGRLIPTSSTLEGN